jgi:hypothetical protein
MKSELHDSQIPYFLQFQRPLLIFLGLLYLDRPASVNELCWLLNASEPTIRRDLSILRRFEAIQPAGRGRFQAIKPVPTSSDFGKFFMKFFTKTLLNINDTDSNQELLMGININNRNRKNFLAKSNTAKTPAKRIPEPTIPDAAPKRATKHQPKRPAAPPDSKPDCEIEGRLPEPDPILIRALQKSGIFGAKLDELSRQSHLTPEYITGWEAYLRQHQPKQYSTGLLVHILSNAQPLPEEKVNGHPQDCICRECDPHYYARCYFCKQYPCVCGENPVES